MTAWEIESYWMLVGDYVNILIEKDMFKRYLFIGIRFIDLMENGYKLEILIQHNPGAYAFLRKVNFKKIGDFEINVNPSTQSDLDIQRDYFLKNIHAFLNMSPPITPAGITAEMSPGQEKAVATI